MDPKMHKNDNVILMKLVCIECKERYDFDEMLIHRADGETFHVCPFCEDEFKAKEYLASRIIAALTMSGSI